ncbi:hypothetical protein FACS1894199_18680 [Bacteroidia bacterium]|nr:hypothetical protein FACS1894199_18680 [Bacteroidia bacterium]
MKNEIRVNKKNEIILYQPDNTAIQLEVLVENETVWLTQDQIALLFGTQRPAITKHLGNIFKSGELEEKEVRSILELTTIHGAIADKTQVQHVKIYNLDAILSVGYRVNSINATMFRRWANRILKEYILKGYALNQRFEQVDDKLGTVRKLVLRLCLVCKILLLTLQHGKAQRKISVNNSLFE